MKFITFYNKYIEIDNQIIDSDEYKSKNTTSYRKINPEHSQYEHYNLLQIVKYALLNIQKNIIQIISFIRG